MDRYLSDRDLPFKSGHPDVARVAGGASAPRYAKSHDATGGHLAGEMFKAQAGVNLVHVPYKGTSQAIADLVSGQVQVIFDQPVNSMQYVRTGQLRALGVASLKRLSAYPDLPTVFQASTR